MIRRTGDRPSRLLFTGMPSTKTVALVDLGASSMQCMAQTGRINSIRSARNDSCWCLVQADVGTPTHHANVWDLM